MAITSLAEHLINGPDTVSVTCLRPGDIQAVLTSAAAEALRVERSLRRRSGDSLRIAPGDLLASRPGPTTANWPQPGHR